MTCDLCGGRVSVEIVPFLYKGQVFLGEYEAEVCHSCGEIFFSEDAFREIKRRAKIHKIWGRNGIPKPEKIEFTVFSNLLPVIEFETLFRDPFPFNDFKGGIPR